MELLTANLSIGKAHRVTEGGRDYLVVPMTTITADGVLPGSRGPLLYPSQETINSVPEWDGTPIVVYHPQKHGRHCSAMEVPEQHIGTLRNSVWQGKLKHEGWLDVEKLQRADAALRRQSRPEIMPSILNGQAVEVSTGLYTTNVPQPGTSKHGRPYSAVATDFRPDHLAILPDQVGACSVNDGCGLMVNANPEGHNQYTHGDSGKPLHHMDARELQDHYDNHPEFAAKFEKAFGQAPITSDGSGHAEYIKAALKRKMDVPDHIAKLTEPVMSTLERRNLKEGVYKPDKPTTNRRGEPDCPT